MDVDRDPLRTPARMAPRRWRRCGRVVGPLLAAGLLVLPPAGTAPAWAYGGRCPSPEPGPAASTPMAASQREALFEAAWSAIDQRSYDPSHGGVDWAAVKSEFAPRIAGASTEGEMDALLAEMIGRLAEDEAAYLPGPSAEPPLGSGGLGVLFDQVPTEKGVGMLLTYVMPGSPAERAGLHERDRIMAVDGDGCPRLSIVRGEPGSSVDLLVASPGAEARTVTVVREVIDPVVVPEARILAGHDGDRIGYLRIPGMDLPDTATAVEAALTDLFDAGPMQALILDLRSTAGTNDAVMDPIAGQFVSGPVAHIQGRDGAIDWEIPAGTLLPRLQDLPLAVLIDGRTSGCAELLAGVLRGAAGARTIGSRTAGDSRRAEIVALPAGRSLNLTMPVDLLLDGTPLTPVPADAGDGGVVNGLAQPEAEDPDIAVALDGFYSYGGTAEFPPLVTPAPAGWNEAQT